ncbi:MAG: DUF2384 domain-containing protein [Thiotrichales bacterium]|jgi:predicted XRE-type DNA-binding protein|nr:DUF2384 domain-containing protein [Thiotrichales bacterium]MBT3837497.1 DUF2384 domain-containing protein [Thiotrichales bacterium]MBT4261125.1 DUF2384 domain-containing protein [Thiotrichales bacterium]MBT5292077.1 DUF2384 domain-containing protein [Thiotrichales bacterium]MBT6173638.1 DUF2384 domain-containing protein [Thiotrichales bacterium]
MSAIKGSVNEQSDEVLTKALLNAAKEMGLSQKQVGEVIGKGQSSLSRLPVTPDSKAGELALILIRIYRSLFVQIGGDREQIRHWMATPNRHTHGTPSEQIKNITGLMRVANYLDAIRGKI